MLLSSSSQRLLLASAVLALAVGGAQNAFSGDGQGQHGSGLPVFLSQTLDAAAQDTDHPGFLWQGTGNPATGFLVQRDEDAGIELAIKGILRGGSDIPPTYVDDRGLIHIQVPAGPQPGNPTRAAWNFTYSLNTALGGSTATLADYDAELAIDLDPSEHTDYLRLELTKLGPPGPGPEPDTNGYGWKNDTTVLIGDDEGTQQVTQNSQNYGFSFYRNLIDTDEGQPGIQPYNFGPAQFDVEISVRPKSPGPHGIRHADDSRREIAHLHVVFDVVNP